MKFLYTEEYCKTLLTDAISLTEQCGKTSFRTLHILNAEPEVRDRLIKWLEDQGCIVNRTIRHREHHFVELKKRNLKDKFLDWLND